MTEPGLAGTTAVASWAFKRFGLQFNEVVCTHYRAEFGSRADGAIRVVPSMMDL
jgi:hypothetical protein